MSTTTNTPAAAVPAAQEIRTLALQILEVAESSELSRSDLLKLHPKLGSDENLSTAAAGNMEDATATRFLPHYSAALAALTSEGDDAMTLYDDISTARAVRGQTTRLILSKTLARILFIKGETGSGKTSVLDIIKNKYNGMVQQPEVFRVEASAGWNDKPSNMLGQMLQALGVDPGRPDATTRMDRLIDTINGRGVKTVFQLDEVHDFGVRCLRTLKTVVNKTEVKIQLACHKRLFRTIETAHADDLSQLTGNRLLAIIDLPAPVVEDVETILKRRLPALNGDTAASARELARHAKGNGNLAFVREVIVRAQARLAKTRAAHFTRAELDACIAAELKGRAKTSVSL